MLENSNLKQSRIQGVLVFDQRYVCFGLMVLHVQLVVTTLQNYLILNIKPTSGQSCNFILPNLLMVVMPAA